MAVATPLSVPSPLVASVGTFIFRMFLIHLPVCLLPESDAINPGIREWSQVGAEAWYALEHIHGDPYREVHVSARSWHHHAVRVVVNSANPHSVGNPPHGKGAVPTDLSKSPLGGRDDTRPRSPS